MHFVFLWGFSKDKLLMRKPTKLVELRALITCVSEFLKICGTSVHVCLEEVMKQNSGLIQQLLH
jgi:hypothetical protein